MANNNLSNKYFVRRDSEAQWEDITTKFDGLKVLSIEGFGEQGDSVNVYAEQWVNQQGEDFLVTNQDGQGNDVIIRQNVDLQMTIIFSRRYTNNVVDEQSVYNAFVAYLNGGAFYLKSAYPNMQAHVICLKGFKPTTQKLHRNEKSYIMATISLHCLDAQTSV